MDWGVPEPVVSEIVSRALAEDLGPGDITTAAVLEPGARGRGRIVAKAGGVVAGLFVAGATFRRLDPQVRFEPAAREGQRAAAGDALAVVEGSAAAILAAERTALNFLQRMCGIATLTARFVEAVEGTSARICDTRKTAPGLRALDKYAVRMGGGRNHRVGLFDGVLIKDNHVRAAGGLARAVARARERGHHLARIEVEAASLTEVQEAVEAGVDVILLDNMTPGEVRKAVSLVGGRCGLEVSGGVTLANVRAYADCGVDYVSVGALTHSAPALDISLELEVEAGG